MRYVIKLKDSDMYLQEDDSYTPNPLEASCFFEFADAKSYASVNEEIASIDNNDNVQVIG